MHGSLMENSLLFCDHLNWCSSSEGEAPASQHVWRSLPGQTYYVLVHDIIDEQEVRFQDSIDEQEVRFQDFLLRAGENVCEDAAVIEPATGYPIAKSGSLIAPNTTNPGVVWYRGTGWSQQALNLTLRAASTATDSAWLWSGECHNLTLVATLLRARELEPTTTKRELEPTTTTLFQPNPEQTYLIAVCAHNYTLWLQESSFEDDCKKNATRLKWK